MPRAALLQLHARVAGMNASSWEDPALVQVWGPRFSTYVVPARDHAIFTLARIPDSGRIRERALDLADRLERFLAGRRLTERDAARGIGAGGLRYATLTGRILIRWEGARAPVVWTVPPPEIDPAEARRELARRYLHVYGPTTPEAFESWAGIEAGAGDATFAALGRALTPVRTPIGDAWILGRDEAAFHEPDRPAAPARLLPSGDAYYLLQGLDRELLLPDAARRAELWTSRVWPGALLVAGEIVGTWRRAKRDLSISLWRRLSRPERTAVEAEAASLPLPGEASVAAVRWA
jgi:hypothetical protein